MIGEQVTHHAATTTTVDEFGNPTYAWTDHTLTGVPVWPVEGAADTERTVVKVRMSLIVQSAVGVDDQFTVRGFRCRQYRSPMPWVNPHLRVGGRGTQVYVERIV